MENNKGSFAFYVAPKLRGQGYSLKLIEQLIKIAKEKQIDYLYAGIEHDNFASIKSLTRAGFTKIGTDKDGMIEFELDFQS